MNATACDNVRDQLSAYLDGELAENERREVHAHLDGCAACREELAELRSMIDTLRALPRVPAPPELAGRVRAAIEREGSTSNVVRVMRWAFPESQGQRMLAAAALVGLATLVGLGVAVYGPAGPPRSSPVVPQRADAAARVAESAAAPEEKSERLKRASEGGFAQPSSAEPASPPPAKPPAVVASGAAAPPVADGALAAAKELEAPKAREEEPSLGRVGESHGELQSPAAPPEPSRPSTELESQEKPAKQDAAPAEGMARDESMAVVDGIGDDRLQASAGGEALADAPSRRQVGERRERADVYAEGDEARSLPADASPQEAPASAAGRLGKLEASEERPVVPPAAAAAPQAGPDRDAADRKTIAAAPAPPVESKRENGTGFASGKDAEDDAAALVQMEPEARMAAKKAKEQAPTSFLELMSRPGGLLYRIDTQTGKFFRDGGIVEEMSEPSLFASVHLLAATDGASPLMRMVLPAEGFQPRSPDAGVTGDKGVASGSAPMPSVGYTIKVIGCRVEPGTPGAPGSDERPVRVSGAIEAPVLDDGQTPLVSGALQGTSATFDVVVLRDGSVGNVAEISAPDLPANLRPEVRRAMLQWRFTPATCSGEPVATIFRMELTWKRGR